MERCIKCGREIADGELFCLECSMNPEDSPLQDGPTSVFTMAVGRMQTPKPARKTQSPVAVKTPKTKSNNRKLKLALALTSVLLVATLSFLFWQYESLRTERNRLNTKQADMLLREQETQELQAQVEELLRQRDDLQEKLEEQETELKSLRSQLSDKENSQYQNAYDLSNTQAELIRLEEENKQLLLLEQDLEAEIKRLTAALSVAQEDQIKAEFMDTYVVFVENNGENIYHTYDCAKFSKSNFWAYSRKLAENNGFSPCSVCGGKP